MQPQQFSAVGEQLIGLLTRHYEALAQGQPMPIMPQMTPDEQLAYWEAHWKEDGATLLAFFEALVARATQVNHPHFIGHQVSAPHPAQVLTDTLLSALNNSIAVFEMGSSGLALEKICVDILLGCFPLGDRANGIFVSGGSIGNLTALLAARQAKAGYDAWTEGNGGDLAVMVSEEAHYCVARAVQSMGLGASGIIKIPTDEALRIRPDALEDCYQTAIAAGKRVIAVVGNACSTSTGTYDPLDALADFCERHGLWFHVDGAHGAPVAFTERYRHLVRGIERADSIVMDFHKMMLAPALTTVLLFRDGQYSHEAFSQKADYLLTVDREWHQGANRTLECTRPMMSVRGYVALKFVGMDYLSAYITRMYDLGQYLAARIIEMEGWELALPPDGNIVCFRYSAVSASVADRFNLVLRQRLLASGAFYIVQTVVQGRLYLRTTIIHPSTEEVHLDALMASLDHSAKALVCEMEAGGMVG